MSKRLLLGALLLLLVSALMPAMAWAVSPAYNKPEELPRLMRGELAGPKPHRAPSLSPSPTVIYGGTTGFAMNDLKGLTWGLYGLDYDGYESKLNAVYFWQDRVRFYRSADSTVPMDPETAYVRFVPGPVRDSFQDFSYCRYDNSIWTHSSKFKKVFKIAASNGTILDSFRSPAVEYPTGIAFDERHKQLYLIDRKYEGNGPGIIYVTDTLGNVIRQANLGFLGYSYAGARCLDMDYSNTNPNWPSLLLVYSYFNSGAGLDSCGLFELDRTDFHIINRWNMDFASFWGNMRGVSYDPRDGNYWVGSMQSPDNAIWKVQGAHPPTRTLDAGVMTIQAPRGFVNLGSVITPTVIVRNFGSTAQTIPVRLYVGSDYNRVVSKSIPAGMEDTVTFTNWTASTVGRFVVKCTTELDGDVFNPNDLFIDTVIVQGHDVGVTHLLAPTGHVDSGVTVTPACSVYNYGTTPESYAVRMKIGADYNYASPVNAEPAGQAVYVTFPDWVAQPMGWSMVTCTTELTGDVNTPNDAVHDSVFVGLIDAQAVDIQEPTGTIDSGTVVTPQADVRNNGNQSATFLTRLYIGSSYMDTQTVTLPPVTTQLLSFMNWTADQCGVVATKCTVELAGDLVPPNNVVTGTVEVRLVDAEALAVVAPTGSVDSGTAVVPQASVKNNGTGNATFDATFSISDGYSNTQSVNLDPGHDTVISFTSWTAGVRGSLATKCTVALTGDQRPANNVIGGTVDVAVTDVGCEAVVHPTGNVDTLYRSVQAGVRNFGTTTQTFDAVFQIFDSTGVQIYTDTKTESTLAGGAGATLIFADWTGTHVLGNYTTKCSTLLSDVVPENNAATGAFVVVPGNTDVGSVAIVSPNGTVDTGTVQTPSATVKNFGDLTETFGTVYRIIDPLGAEVYNGAATATNVAPNTAVTLTFSPTWTVAPETGLYTARCSTTLGDWNPVNDTVSSTFEVSAAPPVHHDVGAVAIIAPAGVVDSTSPKMPQATVHNYGEVAETFHVLFTITNDSGAVVYSGETLAAALGVGATAGLTFPNWLGPIDTGDYVARCSTELGDANPANDTVSLSFRVVAHALPLGWHQMTSVPLGVKGKNVKDGGAIAYQMAGDTASFIYAFKGNNTCEFYQYNVQTNTWATKESIPVFGYTLKKKKVKKGSALIEVDGAIYGTKGNNTVEFWRYTPGVTPYPWVQMPDVPTGARRVKEGTGFAAVELGGFKYIYFLKGSNTTEFYRFNIASNVWENEAFAPVGTSGRNYKDGSSITYDGVNYIYALKAAYNELQRYRVDSNVWTTQRASMPLIGTSGRKKKVGSGAGIAYAQRYVYGLKGNNTFEFWAYQTDSDRWAQKEDMPTGGGKKVKGGGRLIRGDVQGQAVLWALKGSNNLEFWQYVLPLGLAASEPAASSQTMSGGATVAPAAYALHIAPNPFSSATSISYSLPKPGNVCLRLYDVTGKLVSTFATGYHDAGTSSFNLRPSFLSRGIYLLKFTSNDYSTTRKLVIE